MALRTERRVPLNRERVLDAALHLVDEDGIDSLSMRKLGQTLGVEAMALYNHVANKDDILHGIVDLVIGEFELPSSDEPWEAAIRTCAISVHDSLLRHPWACNLILSTTSVRPARMRYMESLLSCLRRAGFSPETTSYAYHAIDSHILGFTVWQLGHSMPGGGPHVQTKEELAAFLVALVPTFSPDDYPYLLEHAELHMTEGNNGRESEFEFGLRLILDGLKRMRDTP